MGWSDKEPYFARKYLTVGRHALLDHSDLVSAVTDGLASALALAGDVISGMGGLFLIVDDEADTSSAAAVQGAGVGAKTKTLNLSLVNGDDTLMTWFTGTITAVPVSENYDGVAGDPTVGGGNAIPMVGGQAEVVLTYDTDAGVTKKYQASDEVGVDFTIPNIFGEVVDVSGASFLDTLAA